MNPAIIVNLNKYKNYLYIITLKSRIKVIVNKYDNWYINFYIYFLVFNNLWFEKKCYWKELIHKSLHWIYYIFEFFPRKPHKTQNFLLYLAFPY